MRELCSATGKPRPAHNHHLSATRGTKQVVFTLLKQLSRVHNVDKMVVLELYISRSHEGRNLSTRVYGVTTIGVASQCLVTPRNPANRRVNKQMCVVVGRIFVSYLCCLWTQEFTKSNIGDQCFSF